MESIEAQKIITKLQGSLHKNGIEAKKLAEELKKLRQFAIDEEDPTLTKVIRLTYEHLEENDTFNIAIPAELAVDEESEEELEPVATPPQNDEERVESLNYLFSIMSDARNKMNREDLVVYRDMLMS